MFTYINFPSAALRTIITISASSFLTVLFVGFSVQRTFASAIVRVSSLSLGTHTVISSIFVNADPIQTTDEIYFFALVQICKKRNKLHKIFHFWFYETHVCYNSYAFPNKLLPIGFAGIVLDYKSQLKNMEDY